MRAVFGLVLVLGMALAGFAVLMVKGYVADTESALIAERQRTAQVVETVEVLAVKVPKAFGDTLMPEDLTTIRYAKEFLPEGYFATETDLFPEGLDISRSVLVSMDVNEIILMSKVTPQGQIAGTPCAPRCGPLRSTSMHRPAYPAFCAPATVWTSTGPDRSIIRQFRMKRISLGRLSN